MPTNNAINSQKITTSEPVTFAGGSAITFTSTGVTSVTLPTAGTLATTSQLLTYSEVTGTTQTMASNNAYGANNASQVVFTLPTTFAIGDQFAILAKGAGGWALNQNSGQSVQFGAVATTSGAGGSISSTAAGDCIFLRAITANTLLEVTAVVGNLTYV